MKNPWAEFTLDFPFLLPSDYRHIMAHNTKVSDSHKIRYDLLPEPYLGNPEAPVILLNLNPGFSELDIPFYEQDRILEMWEKNISHEPQPYPFYLLDPTIEEESGPRWWAKKLREPIELSSRKAVANTFCCVEYFPYHSKQFRPLKQILYSQQYSFSLVAKAIERNGQIILMRGEKYWVEAVPELSGHENLFRLKSTQNVSISRNNCPDGFQVIEQELLKYREN